MSMFVFACSALLFALWSTFAWFAAFRPNGEAAWIAEDAYCSVAHRDRQVVIKRTSATEKWKCMKCGRTHLRIRPDVFD